MEGFAFFAFGDREDLVDVAAGADGNDPVRIVPGLFPDIFLHDIPLRDGHLVFEEPDGADVERSGEEEVVGEG